MNAIFILLLALFCQHPNHHTKSHNTAPSQVTTLDDTGGDGGAGGSGDTGHVPPKP